MKIRHYTPADRNSCLKLFDSNVPTFFAAEEREKYADFLTQLPGTYLVIMDENDRVVGCGGWARRHTEPGQLVLCWGMIDREQHRKGLGRALIEARLNRAAIEPGTDTVIVNTSRHSAGFFQKFGFKTIRIVPNGHAPGINLYEMSLSLCLRDEGAYNRA